VAGFTNLGLDHLDFHQTMDRYVAAKQLLFSADLADRAVINVGDEHGAQIASSAEVPVVAVDPASLSDVEVNASSHSYRWRGRTVRVPLGGMFNVANSLLAAEIAVAAGVHPDRVVDGLARLDVVPGRFEAIARGQAFDVIVDFAHTPDGLGQALAAARDACRGLVIVVFGCGGDRDPSKRPEMGRVSAQLADRVIVTSDNPRTEDPMAIVNAIIAGVPNDYRDRVMVEPDRRAAIAAAVSEARADDLVLIAGKGHERTQTIGTTAYPFDDREVVSTLLEEIMSRGQRTAHDEGHQ
jgi:UDP-N-acetylmuramoyl-L-alanyl-D-glutamate--2,6-diaminopimelate ligase